MGISIYNKINVLINTKIRLQNVLIIIMLSTMILKFPWIPFFNLLKYFTMVMTCLFIFANTKLLLSQKKFTFINAFVGILIIISLFLSYISNGYVNRSSFLANLSDKIIFISWLLFLEIVYLKNEFRKIFKIISNYILIVVGISAIITIIFGKIVFINGNYILGNKFSMSFYVLLMFCTYLCYSSIFNNEKNVMTLIKKIFIWMLSFILCVRVECATGVVAISLIGLLSILFNQKNNFWYIFTLLIVTFFGVIFVAYNDLILKNSFAKYIIINILGEDITLTSRVFIFDKIFDLILPKIWTGYGFGSSYEIAMQFIHAPNLQNGIFNRIAEEGIIVTILEYLFVIYCLWKSKSKKVNSFKNYLIVMFFISSVEIVFNTQLLMISILMLIINFEIKSDDIKLLKTLTKS